MTAQTAKPASIIPSPAHRLGGVAVLAVAGLGISWATILPLIRSSWPLAPVPVPRVDDIVLGIFAWAALAAATWLAASALLSALALLPGIVGRAATRCAAALTPALLRRTLSLLIGTGLGTVSLPIGPATGAPALVAARSVALPDQTDAAGRLPTTPTHSAPDPAFSPTAAPVNTVRGAAQPVHLGVGSPSPHFTATPQDRAPTTAAPDARWLPTPPVRSVDPGETALLAPTPRTAFIPEDVVTVRQGDSLWSLAARQLGHGASDADIARAWPEWYALNADVIGDDPDVIHPGQQLRIPTSGDHR